MIIGTQRTKAIRVVMIRADNAVGIQIISIILDMRIIKCGVTDISDGSSHNDGDDDDVIGIRVKLILCVHYKICDLLFAVRVNIYISIL